MKRLFGAVLLMVAAIAGWSDPLRADGLLPPPPLQTPPFATTLSNHAPLVFGMNATAAATALRVPLTYIRGRPGNETFLAFRDGGGSGFFNRHDRLFLQFRRGRLTGWKGDWGRNWMWQ